MGCFLGGQAAQAQTPAFGALISELRYRGPAGALDEYVEVRNTTDAPLDISRLQLLSNATVIATVAEGTTLPARGHFLFANTGGYSLSGVTPADQGFTGDLPDGATITLVRAPEGEVDRVSGLIAPTANVETAFVRLSSDGQSRDTGSAADFTLVATTAEAVSGSIQGAPGPQNRSSPVQTNDTVGVVLFDTSVAVSERPNQVRLAVAADPNASPNGTLLFRRRIINNGTTPLTRFRIRVTRLTTGGNSSADQSDLRLISSLDESRTSVSQGGSVPVSGLTLEAPSTEGSQTTGGGGVNSSARDGDIVEIAPLAPGAARNYNFLFRVVRSGSFAFSADFEAIRATPSSEVSAPASLIVCSTGSGKNTLYWGKVTGATGYRIYRSATAGGQNYTTPINGTNNGVDSYTGSPLRMWTDTGLTDGVEYFYTVKAVNTANSLSTASNEASDIVDALGIPWDTRNVSTILSAVAAEAQAVSLDGEPVGSLTVAGPDGAIYESGAASQMPPVPYDPVTNELTLEDGSIVALPGKDASEDGLSASAASDGPLYGFQLIQSSFVRRRRKPILTSGGSVVGIRADPSPQVQFKGVSFNLQLPERSFVAVASAGYSRYRDTPHCYIGGAGRPNTDAGVLYQGGRWRAFMNNDGKAVTKQGSNLQDYQPGELLTMQFFMDSRVTTKNRSFYRNTYLQVESLSVDPEGEGKKDTLVKFTRFGNTNNIRPKRFIQVAQNFPKDSGKSGPIDVSAPTGSFMTEIRWQNGRVHFVNGTSDLWRQQYTNRDSNGSYGVVDFRNANTDWLTYGLDFDETTSVALNQP